VSLVESVLARMRKTAGGPTPAVPMTPVQATVPSTKVFARPTWRSTSGPPVDVSADWLEAAGLAPPERARRQHEAEFRSIRREILAASVAQQTAESRAIGPIVLVTSAMPGEGKSFTAVSLALSIASEGARDVLLVDGDVVRRSVSRALGADRRPGLIELLKDPHGSFLDLTLPTIVDRLHFLPAGKSAENSADLFSPGRVAQVFDAMKAALSGHIVIVDSPPIMLASDTQVLSDVAGQVLLVVRSGSTLQESVQNAASRIRKSIPVGVVLNAWVPSGLSNDQSYYGAHEDYVR
jgi:protein-tyrosine kinase